MADLHCHAAALEPRDPRIEAAFAAIEAALPGVRIEHAMKGASRRWTGPIADRVDRVSANLPVPTRTNTLFGNGTSGPGHVWVYVSNVSDEGRGRSGWDAQVKVDVDDAGALPEALPAVLDALAPALRSGAGFVHSRTSRAQLFADPACQAVRDKGVLRDADDRLLIRDLAWVNWLDDATAARLGFPDATDQSRLGGLLSRRPQGWLFRLTEEALDLQRPEYLEQARWAFARFSPPR